MTCEGKVVESSDVQHVMTRDYSNYKCYSEQSIVCGTATNRLRVTANNRLRMLQRTITCVTAINRLHVLRRIIDYVCYDEQSTTSYMCYAEQSLTCVTPNNRFHVLHRTIDYKCYREQSIRINTLFWQFNA